MIQIALFNLHFIKQTLCNLTDVFLYIKHIRLPAKIVFRFLKSESSSSPTKKKETLIMFLKENTKKPSSCFPFTSIQSPVHSIHLAILQKRNEETLVTFLKKNMKNPSP
jgi:hypothetical protein